MQERASTVEVIEASATGLNTGLLWLIIGYVFLTVNTQQSSSMYKYHVNSSVGFECIAYTHHQEGYIK
jgi:hypothetical protein